jgi:hypothetical protein
MPSRSWASPLLLTLMPKYGGTTYTKLDHMARLGPDVLGEYGHVSLTRTDLKRLWELVQASETVLGGHNPTHARQRLRGAVEALREASVAGQPGEPLT